MLRTYPGRTFTDTVPQTQTDGIWFVSVLVDWSCITVVVVVVSRRPYVIEWIKFTINSSAAVAVCGCVFVHEFVSVLCLIIVCAFIHAALGTVESYFGSLARASFPSDAIVLLRSDCYEVNLFPSKPKDGPAYCHSRALPLSLMLPLIHNGRSFWGGRNGKVRTTKTTTIVW